MMGDPAAGRPESSLRRVTVSAAFCRLLRGHTGVCFSPSTRLVVALLLTVNGLACAADFASYPEFRQALLFNEEAFLSLPAASFEEALKAIDLPKSAFVRVPQLPGGIDGPDCAAAMADLGYSPRERTGPLEWVADFRRAFPGNLPAATPGATPESLEREIQAIPEEFPAEFRLYFAGALAYYSGDFARASKNWEELLALPVNSRRQRSIWAEYMLGKTAEDPQEAVRRFRSVRAMAAAGFPDRLGLAFASLGEEARTELYTNKNVSQAMLLYAERHSSSPSQETLNSLRWTAAAALQADESARGSLVADSLFRRIVTAYVLSWESQGSRQRWLVEQGRSWQRSVESSGIDPMDDADRLAWAAYRGGDFEGARRWLERVGEDSPVSLWVDSKLAARSGNLTRARELLVRIDTEAMAKLSCGDKGRLFDEMGAIEVSRGDYSSALELFRKGNAWYDAAYVAESLMTVSELKSQVDRLQAPAAPDSSGDQRLRPFIGSWNEAPRAENWPRWLRDLLARRFARAADYGSAAAYSAFPVRTNQFQRALSASSDTKASREARAKSLFSAACTLRLYGLELLGTELTPDMAIYEGRSPGSAVEERMAHRASFKILPPGPDELERELANRAVLEERFHYRYVAADMAWKAVDLLGSVAPETRAEYLYAAGSWLKNRDPEAADRFYKRIVSTCRGTELAKEAELRGWFPPGQSDLCRNW